MDFWQRYWLCISQTWNFLSPCFRRSRPIPIRIFPCIRKDCKLKSSTLTAIVKRGVKNAGLPPFRFHDLRHYAASIMNALNVPDQYIMQQGDWKSIRVLKGIYQTTLPDYQKKFLAKTSQHFTEINGGMQHAEDGNATRNATQNPEMPWNRYFKAADSGTRTHTVAHWHLKPARLPIPPWPQNKF